MQIKTELLKKNISDYVSENISDFLIDENKIATTVAIEILSQIQSILKNSDYSDFEIVEEIVCIFEKYKIDAGICHDFY